MWLFSNYCKSCLFRDVSIFVAGAFTYMVGNVIEAGFDNGFSTSNIISIAWESFVLFILLYSAWKNRNHVHKTF
jgi:hypothetical protein